MALRERTVPQGFVCRGGQKMNVFWFYLKRNFLCCFLWTRSFFAFVHWCDSSKSIASTNWRTFWNTSVDGGRRIVFCFRVCIMFSHRCGSHLERVAETHPIWLVRHAWLDPCEVGEQNIGCIRVAIYSNGACFFAVLGDDTLDIRRRKCDSNDKRIWDVASVWLGIFVGAVY